MLTKVVNGVTQVCSSEEEAFIRAEWLANALLPVSKPISLQAIVAVLEQKNILTRKGVEDAQETLTNEQRR